MAQHLGNNKRQNALRRRLENANIKPEQCEFEMIAFGPIYSEANDMESHLKPRDIVAALEKKLADAMNEAGYKVLNTVRSQKFLDEKRWLEVESAFAEHFPNLKKAC